MFYMLLYLVSFYFLILSLIVEDRTSLLLLSVGLFFFTTYSGNFSFSRPEWNPNTIRQEPVGVWQDGDSQITLMSDGSAAFELTSDYASRIGLNDSVGGWHKQSDFTIQLLPFHKNEQRQVDAITREGNGFRITKADFLNSFTCPLRIIRIDDKLSLVLLEDGDINSWDGRSGFVLQRNFN